MKTKKNKKETPLGSYSATMESALKQLSVAYTFAEDGAQLDAIRCAAAAIELLLKARLQREAVLAEAGAAQ